MRTSSLSSSHSTCRSGDFASQDIDFFLHLRIRKSHKPQLPMSGGRGSTNSDLHCPDSISTFDLDGGSKKKHGGKDLLIGWALDPMFFLGGGLGAYTRPFIYTRWCMISDIKRMSSDEGTDLWRVFSLG